VLRRSELHPVTLRDEGVAVHREDVDVPEILFANGCPGDSSRPPSAFSASTSTSRTGVISSNPSEIDQAPRNHDIALGGCPRAAIWPASRPQETPSGVVDETAKPAARVQSVCRNRALVDASKHLAWTACQEFLGLNGAWL
jgi:hypothetical protein